jgi:capsular exopolysaccharide synthesis family protein
MDDFSDNDELRDPTGLRARNLLGELLSALLGRWHWIALLSALTLGLAHYYLSVAPKNYESTAAVQVKTSGASSVVVTNPTERAAASELDLKSVDAINTIIGKFNTFSLIQTMLEDNPDLLTDPDLLPAEANWTPVWLAPPPERTLYSLPPAPAEGDTTSPAASRYREELTALARRLASPVSRLYKVAARRASRIVDIKVNHTNPGMARRLADAIVETYIKIHVDRRSGRTESALETIQRETEKAQDDLQESQNALAAYRTALTLVEQLKDQETKLASLLLRYRDKHPDVISSRKLLEDVQTNFLREFDAARQSAADRKYWETVQLQASGGAREDAVKEAIRLLQARSEVLTSEIQNRTQTYNILLTQKAGADVSKEDKEAEILPIEPAREGILTKPRPSLIYAAGAMAGLMLGGALALLFTKLDNKIHTVSDLERATGAPVLASIAAVRRKVLAEQAAASEKEKSTDNDAPPLTWAPELFFRDNGSRTVEAEMIRNLRTSIILLGPAETTKIILFTSALPAEGKSFVSSNIAASFAMSGARTVLVDLDLRRPRQQNMFGTDRKKGTGVADVLASQCKLSDALHPSGLENLTLFLAGTHAPNPAELLNSQRLKDVIAALSKHFDRVIVDTAPLLPVSDTRLIAKLADTCILVSGAEKTPKGAILRALDLLGWDPQNPAKSKIGGCVLNGTIESRRNLGYNYSYGYYGKYGGYGKKYGSVYGDDAEDEKTEKKRRPKGSR